MKNFRHFFRENLKSPRIVLMEMPRHGTLSAHDVGKFPLPLVVNNVVNMFSGPTQSNILQWIFTQGLHHAAAKRMQLANWLSQKIGKEIPQDAVFSAQARKEYPELQNFPIDQLWHKLGGEPDDIPITGSTTSQVETDTLSLGDINHALIQKGFEPLHFGGEDGLMEYIEGGSWNKMGPHQIDSPLGKQGHDLTLKTFTGPEGEELIGGIKAHPKDHKRNLYSFGTNPQGGFIPAIADKAWREALDRAKYRSRKLIQQVQAQAEEDIDSIEDPEHLKILQMLQDGKLSPVKSKRKVPFEKRIGLGGSETTLTNPNTGFGEMKLYFDEEDDEEFADAEQALSVGLDMALRSTVDTPGMKSAALHAVPDGPIFIGNNDIGSIEIPKMDSPTQWNDAAIKEKKYEILSKLVNRGERSIITQLKKRDPVHGTLNLRLDQLLRAGYSQLGKVYDQKMKEGKPEEAEALGWSPEKIKDHINDFSLATGSVPTKTRAGIEQENVDLNELLKQGWTPRVDDKEFGPKGLKLKPTRKVLFMQKPGAKNMIKLVKLGDGTWNQVSPRQDDVIDIDDAASVEDIEGSRFGNLKKVTTKDGETFVVKATKDGWRKVREVGDATMDSPILSNIKLPSNTSLTTQLTYEKQEAQQRMDDLYQNPENYADKIVGAGETVKNGEVDNTLSHPVPLSILSGVIAKLKTANIPITQQLLDDGISHGAEAVLQNVGHMAFKYGSLHKPKLISIFHDKLQKVLGADYSEELGTQIANVIRQAVSNGEEIPVHDSGPALTPEGSVRSDVHKILLSFGRDFRKNIAGNAAIRAIRKDVKRKDKGQGSDVSGDEDDSIGTSALDYARAKNDRKEIEDDDNTLGDIAAEDEGLRDLNVTGLDDIGFGTGDSEEYDIDSEIKGDTNSLLSGMSPEEIRNLSPEVLDTLGLTPDDVKNIVPDDDKDVTKGREAELATRDRLKQRYDPTIGSPDVDVSGNKVRTTAASSPTIGAKLDDVDLDTPDTIGSPPVSKLAQLRARQSQAQATPPPAAEPPAEQPMSKLAQLRARQSQAQATPPPAEQPMSKLAQLRARQNKQEHFVGYKKWQEMVGTSAVYDGTKPKDGDGFNWWGAVGHPLGISIKGGANTSKKDPKGKENGNRTKKK